MTLAHVAAGGPSGWEWHAHPDVWLLTLVVGVAYAWAVRRLGPGASRRQQVIFYLGLAALWLHSDYPIHDLGENYLFFVHMFQHIGFQLIAAPLLLVGCPGWLLRRLLVQPRAVYAVVSKLSRPLAAAAIFNVTTVLSHWPVVVNGALENHELHFVVHVVIFASAVLMWLPVLNRLPELPHLSPPAKMVYLFLQSVLPTIPASFLTFGTSPLYSFYAQVPRPFSFSVLEDQQLAGAMMKIYAGGILWVVIAVLFFRWYAADEEAQRIDRRARQVVGGPQEPTLTWAQVERELAATAPPPDPSDRPH